jgi:hypothetical protein
LVVVASNLQRRDDKIDPDVTIQRYSLCSDPVVVLILLLRTPCRRRNNLVSDSIPDASTSMVTFGASNDLVASTELVDMLSNILAQLTTINKRLQLQGEAINQLFKGNTVTVVMASFPAELSDKNSQASGVQGSGGGGKGNCADSFHHPPGPHHRDMRDELRNSFHQAESQLSKVDGDRPLTVVKSL